MTKPVIVWFRRDLRLQDNLALQAAIETNAPIIPLFIIDPTILKSRMLGTPRLDFLLHALHSLNQDLRLYRGQLWVKHGQPFEVLAELVRKHDVITIFFNRDYSPYARQRDRQIAENFSVSSFHDALLHPPTTIMKSDGTPYVVYTPFKKQWLAKKHPSIATYDLNEANFQLSTTSSFVPTLEDLGFSNNVPIPEATSSHALKHLKHFTDSAIFDYQILRNRLVIAPWALSEDGSSRLSPYLRFGLLSPRQVYWTALNTKRNAPNIDSEESVDVYISELVWREFYMHILYHFPHVARGNFREKYNGLVWENEPADIEAWQNGQTGYPIIDAAMRQLTTIGWMPNRARMIVASFLTKDLLVYWHYGEQFFMQCLLDGDPAANNGGWQWAAGTGTDAQPYFRIFNPISQSKKFDPDGVYIRYWLPELADVPNRYIHSPWEMDSPPSNYPQPIVDHSAARNRALAVYKRATEQK